MAVGPTTVTGALPGIMVLGGTMPAQGRLRAYGAKTAIAVPTERLSAPTRMANMPPGERSAAPT
jgi:hypothetical protein